LWREGSSPSPGIASTGNPCASAQLLRCYGVQAVDQGVRDQRRMEVSALKYSGGIGLHGRSALLRLQSDERLIAYMRKGNTAAFEVLVSRYETRLLAFCRHLLGSREDAEDVLQEVLTAAFNAILADERPINVRPWLYRIARNRSLNHLRRAQAIGVDSMDHHLSDHGASTADKVHEREEFRLLVGDIHELPETQKTALVLREMDALSYEQIAEAMETTVPSVKSLLVRARVSLAEAAEARLLSCDEVRIELGEVAEGLKRRPNPLVRRHLRNCKRCTVFRSQLKETNKALAALMPIGPLVILKKLAIFHLGHSASASSGATAAGSGAGAAGAGAAGAGAAGAGAAGAGVAAGGTALAGSGGFISAGLGAIATKAAAGLAAAALVTAGAVEADHTAPAGHATQAGTTVAQVPPHSPAEQAAVTPLDSHAERRSSSAGHRSSKLKASRTKNANSASNKNSSGAKGTSTDAKTTKTATTPTNTKTAPTGRDQTQTDPTVMPPTSTSPTGTTPTGTTTSPTGTPTTTGPTTTSPVAPPPEYGQPPTTTGPGPVGQPPQTTTSPSTTTGTGTSTTSTSAKPILVSKRRTPASHRTHARARARGVRVGRRRAHR
jgi:RNA polymerase sigma factor (sigma-70 family)